MKIHPVRKSGRKSLCVFGRNIHPEIDGSGRDERSNKRIHTIIVYRKFDCMVLLPQPRQFGVFKRESGFIVDVSSFCESNQIIVIMITHKCRGIFCINIEVCYCAIGNDRRSIDESHIHCLPSIRNAAPLEIKLNSMLFRRVETRLACCRG